MADSQSNGHTTQAGSGFLRTFIAWTRASLSHRLGSMFDDRRNVSTLLGYKPTLTYQDYLARYERQDIASVLVDGYPEETWGIPPTLTEAGEHATPTPFEMDWEALATRLKLFTVLERADKLAQLGHYSVILLGLKGQTTLDQPARPVRSPEDVVYLEVYDEDSATIERFEEDASLPTFRKPLFYRLSTEVLPTGRREPSPGKEFYVHASRVLHIPGERMLTNEVYSIPALQQVYNLLDNLLMIVGGSAYGFWQDHKRRVVVKLDDEYTLTAADLEHYQKETEEFDQLKNFLLLKGMDAKALEGTLGNPVPYFQIQIDLLAGASHYPKRLLLGSERGELASSQDERELKSRVARRQEKYAGPYQVLPFADRLIQLQAVRAPQAELVLRWENLLTLTEEQMATVAKNIASAVRTAVGQTGDFRQAMSFEQFVDEYLSVEFTGVDDATLLTLAPGPDEDQQAEATADEDEADEEGDTETVADEETMA